MVGLTYGIHRAGPFASIATTRRPPAVCGKSPASRSAKSPKPSGCAGRKAEKSCNGNWRRWPGPGGFPCCRTGNCCPAARGCRRDDCPMGHGPPCRVGWVWNRRPPCLPGGTMRRSCRSWSARTASRRPRSCSRGSTFWAAYAVAAPQVRLDRWRFAVAGDGRVAVHCQFQSRQVTNLSYILPPLPGQRWVEQEGIAVPAGWTWSPAVETAILRQVFGLAAGDLALWHTDGTWERIAADEFVRSTRTAVRETGKNLEPHPCPRETPPCSSGR